jgi:hypothetical protein
MGLELASSIWTEFLAVAGSASWPYPEPVVTYESALLPRAMIVGGGWIGDGAMVGGGLAVLDWLVRNTTTPDGHLSPIGNRGWWPSGGPRARFDQQPLEASALLQAAHAALVATGDPTYLVVAERAFSWFLGSNDLQLVVADPDRGGCRDGLGADGCNGNQGAESTLAWLIAVERMRAIRARWGSEPIGSPRAGKTLDPRVAAL